MPDTHNFEIKDNSREYLAEVERAIIKGLTECGITAEAYAAVKCPVDTGRLRASITHQVAEGEHAVYVGTNVEYAPYVELGTSRQKAQPYLRPAIENHISEYKNIIINNLKGG